MKKIIFLTLSFTFSSAFAGDVDAVVSCYNILPKKAVAACAGVRTASDVDAVVSCYDKLPNYAVAACAGVKTASDVDAVVSCYDKLPNDVVAVACVGVKN